MKKFLTFLLVMIMMGDALGSPGRPLPLPRFASLRAKTVNLHVGPGNNYPTEWQFERPGLPVEIIAEFDTWRQIRDWQGTQGWVHKSLLCGKRMVVIQPIAQKSDTKPVSVKVLPVSVTLQQQKLYRKPEETSPVVAHLEPGVLGKLMECRNRWCRLNVQGHQGWIQRCCLWGVYVHEEKFK